MFALNFKTWMSIIPLCQEELDTLYEAQDFLERFKDYGYTIKEFYSWFEFKKIIKVTNVYG